MYAISAFFLRFFFAHIHFVWLIKNNWFRILVLIIPLKLEISNFLLLCLQTTSRWQIKDKKTFSHFPFEYREIAHDDDDTASKRVSSRSFQRNFRLNQTILLIPFVMFVNNNTGRHVWTRWNAFTVVKSPNISR